MWQVYDKIISTEGNSNISLKSDHRPGSSGQFKTQVTLSLSSLESWATTKRAGVILVLCILVGCLCGDLPFVQDILVSIQNNSGKTFNIQDSYFQMFKKPSPQSLHWLYRNLQAGGNKTGMGRTFVAALIQPLLTRYMGLFWFIHLLGVLCRFQPVQVISRRVILWAGETSTYSWCQGSVL